MINKNRYVFGPVPSRRLGISLGVDLIPYKTCNLNCLYCECGPTTRHINTRDRFADPREVSIQVREAVQAASHIDHITFSGSGEPTLSIDLGTIIREIRGFTGVPIAVLTNGTLLDRPDVRNDLMDADLVLPSLDAATPEAFARINQYHPDLCIEVIIDGLVQFRSEFPNPIWLEVFILEGINTSDPELDALHEAIRRIHPDRVQLNSLDRPPAFPAVVAAPFALLERIRARWEDLPVEIIKRMEHRGDVPRYSQNLENSLVNALQRRPMTLKDLQAISGIAPEEIRHYLDILEKENRIKPMVMNGEIFFQCRD